MAELTALWAPPDHECRDEFAFRLITANSTRCLLHTPPPQFRMRPNHVGGFWLPSLAAVQHLRPRRHGLAHRLGSEFRDDLPQGADTWRERVAVALNDGVKLLGERGGFVRRLGQGAA